MHLDSPEALGVLNTLFETVAPSSLRPVDMLLKSMFTTPVTMVRALIICELLAARFKYHGTLISYQNKMILIL